MDKNLIDGLDDKDWALIRCQEMLAAYHLICLHLVDGNDALVKQLHGMVQSVANSSYNEHMLKVYLGKLPEMIACAKNNKEVTLECIENNESRGNTKSTPEENDQDDIDED